MMAPLVAAGSDQRNINILGMHKGQTRALFTESFILCKVPPPQCHSFFHLLIIVSLNYPLSLLFCFECKVTLHKSKKGQRCCPHLFTDILVKLKFWQSGRNSFFNPFFSFFSLFFLFFIFYCTAVYVGPSVNYTLGLLWRSCWVPLPSDITFCLKEWLTRCMPDSLFVSGFTLIGSAVFLLLCGKRIDWGKRLRINWERD